MGRPRARCLTFQSSCGRPGRLESRCYYTTRVAALYQLIVHVNLLSLRQGAQQCDVCVDYDGRELFCILLVQYLLETSVEPFFVPLRQGFQQVIGGSLLSQMLSADELGEIICGNRDLNFEHLKETCQYQGYDFEGRGLRTAMKTASTESDVEQSKGEEKAEAEV